MIFLLSGECSCCGAEVGSPEGTSLEAVDTTAECQVGTVWPYPGTGVGCRPVKERTHCERCDSCSSGWNGIGGVLETSEYLCL